MVSQAGVDGSRGKGGRELGSHVVYEIIHHRDIYLIIGYVGNIVTET